MMHFVIDKTKKFVVSQHEEEALCRDYIANCAIMYGHDIDNYVVAKGAKDRDAKIKELKK